MSWSQLFRKKKYLIMLIIIFLFFSGYLKKIYLTPEIILMHLNMTYNDISCHYVRDGDALPSAEDPEFSPPPNSIFFHETSCRGGLNSRQACSIESASRAHPDRQVYVLFSSPVSELVDQRSCIAKLRQLPNIRFARVHITEYARNTPMEVMVVGGRLNESWFRIEHTSDALRLLTLYKWGGIYLDTDMIVVKSLKPLGPNWVVKESIPMVSNGVAGISMDPTGRRFIKALIRDFTKTFKPHSWAYNGPYCFTRVLSKYICKRNYNKTVRSTKICNGIEVYPPKYFYPIPYPNCTEYFENIQKNQSLSKYRHIYAHHIWNSKSFNMTVNEDSYYAKLAQQYCPTIYATYGELFSS